MASAEVPSQPPKKGGPQPSLYARKLLQKLSSLHPTESSHESRQSIASWMAFNRKRADGMGEGLLKAVEDAEASGDVARLTLLAKILHQAIMINCPTAMAVTGDGTGDPDQWEKCAALRARLGEMVVLPLWGALARATEKATDANAREDVRGEAKRMIEEWGEHGAFGGPTVLEEYKRGWARAVKEAAAAASEDGGSNAAGGEADVAQSASAPPDDAIAEDEAKSAASATAEVQEAGKESPQKAEQSSAALESASDSDKIPPSSGTSGGVEEAKETGESDAAMVDATPASTSVDDGEGGKVRQRATKRESIFGAVDVEVDFEGVEEAQVEPSQFLDACKVIASIQIARDLGSDAAVGLSSALAGVPPEVEEACGKILAARKEKEDGKDGATVPDITELVSEDALSSLPEDVLDLDLKRARQSLRSYRETIKRQRQARLQCLQLLLASRCSFGSMEAARAFCGGGGGDDAGGDVAAVDMDTVLEKLRKRKEVLVDAMALEGLDVEEDEEEKRTEKEEEALKPLDWFPGQKQEASVEEGIENEPAAKKLKT
ncbi:hypothetical protein ACHAWF_015998 [Thalassiosira exigua]